MPYKESLKSCNSRKKSLYKVTNWKEYNASLKKRGCISLYFPYGDLKSQFINDTPYKQGVSGQEATYKKSYIEFIYVLYRMFNFGLRQITGYCEDLWKSKGLDIKVPSYNHLSDMFESLSLEVRQFCGRLANRISRGESVSIILDSTGLRFGKACGWYKEKYGHEPKRKPWRKLHISMDEDMNVHNVKITEQDVHDKSVMNELMPNLGIAEIIADQAYYSVDDAESLYNRGITPVIPPPHNSQIRGDNNSTWHDKIVQYINDKGSIYAFYKKYNYGRRSRVEAQMSRIKRCIGNSLKTQRPKSQQNEAVIIANILNLWNSFGRPVTVKA
jgi:hypothetical protein